MVNTVKKGTTFSVALGLLDYVNPLVYLLINIIIAYNVKDKMSLLAFLIYIIGVTISLVFGFTIPTVKVLVGLKKFEFKLPVNFVTYVNGGIFISGSVLFLCLTKVSILIYLLIVLAMATLLLLIYKKSGKFNTVAVILGCFGYLFIYATNISIGVIQGNTLSIIFYCLAICFMLALAGIGAFANLMKAQIHWVLESTNIACQLCVLIATIILYC